jgi:hypothetical protein
VPRPSGPFAIVALAVLAVASVGCSDDDGSAADATPVAALAPPAPGRFLTRAELANQLGNLFHRRLYQLAVMTQPGDDASDLGQALPRGTLRTASCEPAGDRPSGGRSWAWSCAVRWETVDGRRETTAYRVRLTSRGCFFAGASPPLEQRYDATIRSYSEHPLNQLQSLRRGC